MAYVPYPKFLEHPNGATCVVQTREDHLLLIAEGWPPPADYVVPEKPAKKEKAKK